ncbi:ROK family transcriptional regulator [Streptomyces paludis]|uniref:ROK family transcriptional regulator n=1 Tax=Streptomyces paludis TaxID=2282738 RepID=A0A345HTD3_9ACTN|nr:ROK family transcriptional regulator [Streptomyces paludis]AXG79957.1 ROK family transcriptional regulator [Streptomyces paludis]
MQLTESAGTVFTVLADAGVATRPQLALRAGLSKPTVSTAVAELESAGLVARSGTSYGGMGRSAAVYGLGRSAGSVLAIDLGSTHTEVRGCALDGTVLATRSTDGDPSPREAVRAVLDSLPGTSVRAAVIAVPDVASVRDGAPPRPATPRVAAAVDALELPRDIPVHIENNVNCAALAELHEGAAQGRDTFGYLQVGYGIGLGLVVGGRVLRGANGAAGEIARLPYPWADGRDSVHEGLEAYAGARSLLRRAEAAWRPADGPCPRSAEELFALAAEETLPGGAPTGQARAAEFVAAHAREVGRLAAAVAAVLDPGLIVLGGGIGANPQLLPGVRAELARLSWPTEAVSSMVGESGTVAGATRLAVARGVRTVTGG